MADRIELDKAVLAELNERSFFHGLRLLESGMKLKEVVPYLRKAYRQNWIEAGGLLALQSRV
jgi:hypothetical protein